jgi:hypothetical protein
MSANPARAETAPKILHLGVNTEFHVAPGERVLFAGSGRFAVVFPGDSSFSEHVFSDANVKSQPARQCQGRFQYYWAEAGSEAARAATPGVMISGVVAPILPAMASGTSRRDGAGTIIVA